MVFKNFIILNIPILSSCEVTHNILAHRLSRFDVHDTNGQRDGKVYIYIYVCMLIVNNDNKDNKDEPRVLKN